MYSFTLFRLIHKPVLTRLAPSDQNKFRDLQQKSGHLLTNLHSCSSENLLRINCRKHENGYLRLNNLTYIIVWALRQTPHFASSFPSSFSSAYFNIIFPITTSIARIIFYTLFSLYFIHKKVCILTVYNVIYVT